MDNEMTIGSAEKIGMQYLKARFLEHRANQLYSVALAAARRYEIIRDVLDGTSTLPVDKIRTIPLSGAEYYKQWAHDAMAHYERAQRIADDALINVQRNRAAIAAACNADKAVVV